MPTIRTIKKGDRNALRALYEREKGRIYTIAAFLLRDEKDAEAAVAQIFKNIWKDVFDGTIASDEAFSDELLKRTLTYARGRIERKETNALHISSATAHRIAEYDLTGDSDACTRAAAALSALGRFRLVLLAVNGDGRLSDADLAKLFLTNTATLKEVFRSEDERLERACAAAAVTVQQLCTELPTWKQNAVLSAETDEKALSSGISLIIPMELSKKKQRRTVLISAVALLLVALIVASCIILPPFFEKTYYADITIKDYGTVTIILYDDIAPITVKNFVELAESGFYDGLTFHRIIEGFMMQGGCPKGDGTGGNTDENGKKLEIKGEFLKNGVSNSISHVRGVVSMARGGDPYYDSASSQFFIVHEDSTFLNGSYAAFGRVLEGMEIVDEICESAKPTDNNGKIKKEEQPVIESIRIRKERKNS